MLNEESARYSRAAITWPHAVAHDKYGGTCTR